jgi:hypothetical protein
MSVIDHNNISVSNINKFLNLEKGHYVIIGQSGSSGKKSLLHKLLRKVRSTFDLNTTNLNSTKIEIPSGEFYSTDNPNKLLGGLITIRIITVPMKKSDIPEWILKSYSCIYLPFQYVQKPKNENDKQQDIHFMDRQISIEELYSMII